MRGARAVTIVATASLDWLQDRSLWEMPDKGAASAKIAGGTASNQLAAQSDSPRTIEHNLDPEKSS
jgi:hypothetical protein